MIIGSKIIYKSRKSENIGNQSEKMKKVITEFKNYLYILGFTNTGLNSYTHEFIESVVMIDEFDLYIKNRKGKCSRYFISYITPEFLDKIIKDIQEDIYLTFKYGKYNEKWLNRLKACYFRIMGGK